VKRGSEKGGIGGSVVKFTCGGGGRGGVGWRDRNNKKKGGGGNIDIIRRKKHSRENPKEMPEGEGSDGSWMRGSKETQKQRKRTQPGKIRPPQKYGHRQRGANVWKNNYHPNKGR